MVRICFEKLKNKILSCTVIFIFKPEIAFIKNINFINSIGVFIG